MKNKKLDISAPRLLLSAQEYLLAAECLPSNGKAKLLFPKNFLYCLSIELGLKAFLRANGKTEEELKNDFGHDLVKLFKKARKEYKLEFENKDLVGKYSKDYNILYKTKGCEYIDEGLYHFYNKYEDLEKAIKQLFKKIYSDCYSSIGFKASQKNLDDFIEDLEVL